MLWCRQMLHSHLRRLVVYWTLTALNQQRKFRDKYGATLGWQLLQQCKLGELKETKACRGTDKVIIYITSLHRPRSYPCMWNKALALFGFPSSIHIFTHWCSACLWACCHFLLQNQVYWYIKRSDPLPPVAIREPSRHYMGRGTTAVQ